MSDIPLPPKPEQTPAPREPGDPWVEAQEREKKSNAFNVLAAEMKDLAQKMRMRGLIKP